MNEFLELVRDVFEWNKAKLVYDAMSGLAWGFPATIGWYLGLKLIKRLDNPGEPKVE